MILYLGYGAQLFSHASLSVAPWSVSLQAPLSMEFSRQEYWSRLPFPTPGDLSNTGTELTSSALVDEFFTTELHGKPNMQVAWW